MREDGMARQIMEEEETRARRKCSTAQKRGKQGDQVDHRELYIILQIMHRFPKYSVDRPDVYTLTRFETREHETAHPHFTPPKTNT